MQNQTNLIIGVSARGAWNQDEGGKTMNTLVRYSTKLSLAGVVAAILTLGPAQAFHKGVVHGGGGGGADVTLDWNNLINVPADIADGDQDTQLDATGIEALVGEHTVDFDTLDDLECTTDQIARFVGDNWVCDGAAKTVVVTSRT